LYQPPTKQPGTGFGSTQAMQQYSPPPAPPAEPKVAPIDQPPLLVDVTPLSLCVETVNDYCDVIIKRNTPVPCDKTALFVTSKNNQTMVKVRVAQGENPRFSQNTHLGELELSGLRQAARGDVQVAVTFEVDSDGIIQVRARDVATGKETHARLRLLGLSHDAQDIANMQNRQQQATIN
jgi:molecular chaperone DnaK